MAAGLSHGDGLVLPCRLWPSGLPIPISHVVYPTNLVLNGDQELPHDMLVRVWELPAKNPEIFTILFTVRVEQCLLHRNSWSVDLVKIDNIL